MAGQLEYWNLIIIFVIYAVSLNLLQGFAGQASIAHAAFGAVGGYTAALLSIHLGLPFVATVILGMAAGLVLGAGVSLPALGARPEFLILLTIAFAYIVTSLLGSVHAFGGTYGITGIGTMSLFGYSFTTVTQVFYVLIVIGIIACAFCWRLGNSPYGRVLKGIREDEAATRSLGKPTVRYLAQVFGITASLAALAGALFVYDYSQATPSYFTLNVAILMVIMVVIGGSGNLLGSVVGAVLVAGSTPVLQNVVKVSPESATFWQQVVFGLALVLVIVFRPAGLLPERMSLRRYLPGSFEVRRNNQPSGSTATRSPAIADNDPAGSTRRLQQQSVEETSPATAAVVSPALGKAAREGTPESHMTPLVRTDEKSPGGSKQASANTRAIVQVTGLRKRFGGITAVAGVDMELPEHRVTALIGPNGAGKSTLFGLFTGFMQADGGSVKFDGSELLGRTPDAVARLGMVRSFQDVRLFRYLSVLENVMLAVPGQPGERVLALFATPRAVRRSERHVRDLAMEQLASVGMAGKADEIAGGLSHGEQKLVAIARILATNARVLLLDEPTSGVAPEWTDRVAQAIRSLPSLGKTVCVVEHNLSFLKKLDAPCYFMNLGRVLRHGPLDDLMRDRELANVYFGVEA